MNVKIVIFITKGKDLEEFDDEIFTNFELGVESVEKLVEDSVSTKINWKIQSNVLEIGENMKEEEEIQVERGIMFKRLRVNIA